MDMKVGIDTFGCNHGVSGLGAYLGSISENFKNNDENQFFFFGTEIDRYTYASENGLGYKAVSIPDRIKLEKAWHFFICNSFVKKNKFDVVLYPAAVHLLPYNFTTPSVAIVNDVYSNISINGIKIVNSRTIRHGLKKADKIIASSIFVKEDLIAQGFNDNKICVIHNGIDHSLFYPREVINGDYVDIKPFAIKKPYFIYAANITTPSKKHCELIRAFGLFKKNTGLPHRLVLSGAEGAYTETVHKEVAQCPYASDIFMTGYFPHESLPELYAGSAGLVFPGVNEGVGLPVLEAMATGIPVACSDSGSLPEVSGGNTVLFDSNNIEDIARAMTVIASNHELCKKNVENGLEWTKNFSWQKTAEETIKILKEVSRISI